MKITQGGVVFCGAATRIHFFALWCVRQMVAERPQTRMRTAQKKTLQDLCQDRKSAGPPNTRTRRKIEPFRLIYSFGSSVTTSKSKVKGVTHWGGCQQAKRCCPQFSLLGSSWAAKLFFTGRIRSLHFVRVIRSAFWPHFSDSAFLGRGRYHSSSERYSQDEQDDQDSERTER
jgi:hypothetical protein